MHAHVAVGGLRSLLPRARNGGGYVLQAVCQRRQLDQALTVACKGVRV